jgi:methylene-fatty-acyl-phospholipid synthase
LLVGGFLLNLWTLKALGIKGMYNGDSFGFLFDAPVTNGPYVYFNDPQYVGTTAACIGSAIYYRSHTGLCTESPCVSLTILSVLAAFMGVVFYISVTFVEGPHMAKIYSNKKK